MAKSTNLNFTQEIECKFLALTSANTTVAATLYTVAANDAVVKSLTATTTDTSAVNLMIYINDGSTDYLLGTVRVAAASGTDGATAAINLLASTLLPGLPADLNNRAVLPLKFGHVLKIACLATMTAAKTTTVTAIIEEY